MMIRQKEQCASFFIWVYQFILYAVAVAGVTCGEGPAGVLVLFATL
jgi:hypothetical protein